MADGRKPTVRCGSDISIHAKSFGAGVCRARNGGGQPESPAAPGQQGQHLRFLRQGHIPYALLSLQGGGLLHTGVQREWTEFRAFQASSLRPKHHKSQKWKTRVRNKTPGFPRTASHFLWAVNNHS